MSDEAPNTKVLEATADALQKESTALEQQIEGLEQKVAALSETAAEKRREAQNAFRAKNAKRFGAVGRGVNFKNRGRGKIDGEMRVNAGIIG